MKNESYGLKFGALAMFTPNLYTAQPPFDCDALKRLIDTNILEIDMAAFQTKLN